MTRRRANGGGDERRGGRRDRAAGAFDPGTLIGTTITLVEPPDAQGCCVVRIGRRRVGMLGAGDAARLGVVSGAAWTDVMARASAETERYLALRAYALRSLTRRAMSRGQAAQRLALRVLKRDPELDRGEARRLGERVADEMVRIGVIDEAALAADVAGTLARRGKTGARLAEVSLMRKRIRPELARRATREAFADIDPLEAATALARTRVERMRARPERAVLLRRLAALLSRRGFDGAVAREAARRAVGGAGDETGAA